MKSYMAKEPEVVRSWHIVDADGQILGRMASKVASVLMGKTKPTYTPHVDTGDCVIIINAEKIRITGKKAQTKEYQRYTGYPGGQRITSYAEMMVRKPESVVRLAVRRMLPKNKIGADMLKKLKIFAGPQHPHEAQKPEKMEIIS